MKKIYSCFKILFVGALFFGVANFATAQALVTTTAVGTPQPIPSTATCTDGVNGGTTSGDMTDVTFTVAGAANTLFGGSSLGSEYEFASIDIEMSHSWMGDVTMTLTKDGVSHDFYTRDFINNPELCDEPFTLSFTPDGTTTFPGSGVALDGTGPYTDNGATIAMAGTDINGTWTLSINDAVGGDGGTLVSASMTFAQVTSLPCVLTCPDDVTVNTSEDVDGDDTDDIDADGACGAYVVVDPVVPGAGCVTTIVNGCTDFSGDDELVFTAGELQMSTVDITGVPTMLPAAGPDSIEIEVCVSGDFGDEGEMVQVMDEAGTIIDTLGDAGSDSEAGIDCEQFCTTFFMQRADYDTAAADGTLTFSVTGNPLVSDFCASNTISASACVPEEMMVADLITNDFNGTDDASGFYPVGTTTVTFTSQGTNGLAVTCSFDVTVVDDEAPSITCPGDQTITLGSGECGIPFNFAVSFDDNCAIEAQPTGDPEPVDGPFGSLEACASDGFTVACTGGNTSVVQALDLSGVPGTYFLTEGCLIFDNAAWGLTTGTIRLYCSNTVASYLTGDVPVATGTFDFSGLPSGSVACAAFDVPYLVDGSCGQTLWLEVDADGVGGIAFMGAECNGNTADGSNTYLASDLCGSGFLNNFGFVEDAFFGYTVQPAGFVNNTDNPDATDLVSGDVLPIGETVFSYQVTDSNGNTSSCEFTVTVNEFPESEQSAILSCIGQVNISVDDECDVVLSADQFLLGDALGCVETDYTVNVWPFNNQANALNNVGGQSLDFNGLLDAQHTYEIVDNDTGNKCWGNFVVEDKLAPTLSCEDITLACTDNTDIGAANGGGPVTVSVNPGAAVSSTLPPAIVELPVATGVVTNVTLDLDISHTWIGDLTVDLTSPSGTTVNVYDGNCGLVVDLVAQYADGNPVFDCGNSAANLPASPNDPFAAFIGESSGGTWTLSVADGVGGDDGVINAVTLNLQTTGALVPGGVAIDNCSGSTVEYTEVTVDGDCTTEFASQIIRTFVATDASGNESEPCVQTISITRESLATLGVPTNYDGLPGNFDIIECSAAVLDPAQPYYANGDPRLDPATYGAPSGVGACGTIVSTFTDIIFPICDQNCEQDNPSYKVLREFRIYDWCTGEIVETIQVLKVMDTTAPDISEISDITVSTDIWGCGATIPLPVAGATDNCTADDAITYTFSSTAGTQVGNTFVISDPAKTMPGAPIVITATATDCCGNSSTTDFNVSVIDLVPPVVNGESFRTVSLSTDGVAKAFAEDFDDGSHDGCGPIEFFVKRMDNGGSCAPIDKHGLYFGSDNGHDVAANNIDDNREFNEVVHFCCADVGNPVMVQFKVCDDANMDGIVGNNGDNCNSVMVEVEVQDKLAPQIICPDNVTISCIELASLGNLQDLSDDFLDAQFGSALAAATCNVNVTQTISGSDACGAGTVFRNFTATNSLGETSTCTQFITVTAGPNNVLTCDRIDFASLNNNIYDWCDVNDNQNNNNDDLPAIQVDCTDGLTIPELDIDIDGLCTEVGLSIEVDTFNFAGGACRKYLVHYEVIDQCVFDENFVNDEGEVDPFNSDNGYFEFYIEVDAFDDEAPVLDCEPIDVVAQSCDGYSGAISISGTDNCTSPDFFSYQFRVDVGADNVDITGFFNGSSVTPGVLGLTEFPIGEHIIYWIVSDGCGNDATCAQLVTIDVNDKEPTPYCIDGLATAVMPSTGTVALWANDFDAGSFDNCEGTLVLSMIPEQDVVGLNDDDAYDQSFDHPNVTQQPNGDWGFEFDCSYIENGVSAIIEVRIYVTDEDGNYDYCTASLRIDDNFDACENTGTLTFNASGTVKTQQDNEVDGVNVSVDASYPEFPMTETVDGAYSFDLIENVDYDITPAKNDDHLNGITTLDIVLIQKHILGLEVITSPYTMIAADVDNNCQVNGSDIIQLRRLLLGKYSNDEFPNNTSWRFVEGDYIFANPNNPCNFSEVAEIINLDADVVENFVATKIGDINGTATANITMGAETRSNENLEFVVAEQALEAGNTYTVDFLAKDFTEVYGFQYTMNLAGAEFVTVNAGALNVTENNFGIRTNGTVVSVDIAEGATFANDAILFSITFEALKNANLSDVLSLNSNEASAEAYVGRQLEVLGSDVVFRTDEGIVADAAFELLQNEPNPFNGQTLIGFELPETSEATLSIYDVTGKVLYTKVDTYAAGYNSVTINRTDVPATGVLYYKLENGENVATMKMIVLE